MRFRTDRGFFLPALLAVSLSAALAGEVRAKPALPAVAEGFLKTKGAELISIWGGDAAGDGAPGEKSGGASLSRPAEAHLGSVNAVAISENRRYAATAGADGVIRYWKVGKGKVVREFAGHEGRVNSVVFSGRSKRILSAGDDKTIRLWDVKKGKPIMIFKGHAGAVLSADLSEDGERVLSASADGSVRLWDAHGGSQLQVLGRHEGGASAVAFSPNGSRAVSGGADGLVKLWVVGSGAAVDPAGAPSRTSSGSALAVGALVKTLKDHRDAVDTVAFSSDGDVLLSAGGATKKGERGDYAIRLWDGVSGEALRTFTGHSAAVRFAVFDRGGRRIVSGGEDATVRFWDTSDGTELDRIHFAASDDRANAGAWGGKDRVLILGTERGAVLHFKVPR